LQPGLRLRPAHARRCSTGETAPRPVALLNVHALERTVAAQDHVLRLHGLRIRPGLTAHPRGFVLAAGVDDRSAARAASKHSLQLDIEVADNLAARARRRDTE
jgi:hypothetical protein